MTIGEKIKRARQDKGMSQMQLAIKTGYNDRSSIAKIESNKVDLACSKIMPFSNALDISPIELLGLEMTVIKKEPARNTDSLDRIFTENGVSINSFNSLSDVDKELIFGIIQKFLKDSDNN